MYSLSTYRGQPYVRTQRSAHTRWLLMGVGATTLGIAGALTYGTFANEYRHERQVAETVVLAEQVTTYHPEIASALSEADQLAQAIGTEVSDPAVLRQFNALRSQARALLATDVKVPGATDSIHKAYLDREVANSVLAVNAAMPNNLRAGEKALRASHEAYQELVDAKADMMEAKATLAAAIPVHDQVLTDSAPSLDGWIYVEEELRIPLNDALTDARNAVLATENKELSSVADFKHAADRCRVALTKLNEASGVVSSNFRYPEPVIPLDEFGNPIVVEVPAPTN